MHLLLTKIPTEEALQQMKGRFPELDVNVIGTYLRYMRISAAVLSRMETLLTSYGLAPARMHILMLLLQAGEEGIRPSDLAEQVGVTRATMTGLLDNLEKSGLIAREPDRNDRRALVIKITPAGIALAERVMPIHMRNIYSLLRDLTQSDHTALRECMAKILTGLERLEALCTEGGTPMEKASGQ
jgi:DNA-binding MarR family transcriptional regulator